MRERGGRDIISQERSTDTESDSDSGEDEDAGKDQNHDRKSSRHVIHYPLRIAEVNVVKHEVDQVCLSSWWMGTKRRGGGRKRRTPD